MVKKKRTLKRHSTYKRNKNKKKSFKQLKIKMYKGKKYKRKSIKKKLRKQKGGNLQIMQPLAQALGIVGLVGYPLYNKRWKDDENSHSNAQKPQNYSPPSTNLNFEANYKDMIRIASVIKPSEKENLEHEAITNLEGAGQKASLIVTGRWGEQSVLNEMLEKIAQKGTNNLLNEPWEIMLVMENLVKDDISAENEKTFGDKSGYFLNIPIIRESIESLKNNKASLGGRTVSHYANQIIPVFLRAYFLFKFMETPVVEKVFSDFWTQDDTTSFTVAIKRIKKTTSPRETEIRIPPIEKIFHEAKNEIERIITYINEINEKDNQKIIHSIKNREFQFWKNKVYYSDEFYEKIIINLKK